MSSRNINSKLLKGSQTDKIQSKRTTFKTETQPRKKFNLLTDNLKEMGPILMSDTLLLEMEAIMESLETR